MTRARKALLPALAGAAALAVAPGAVALAATDARTEECLECHDGADDEVSFPDGTSVTAGIDGEAWARSAHGREIGCTACHRRIRSHPHPDVRAQGAREYALGQAETCRRCHYAYYTRVLDGIHWAQLERGDKRAPTCTDCHGAHDTASIAGDRVAVDRRCARCHEAISKAYEASVHGKALLEAGNPDVPVCTDCHGAHANRDPRTPQARARAHEVCGGCHGDDERMRKYGLSSDVVTTYVADFHGMSNELYAAGAGSPSRPMASCVDCHGVHDIQAVEHGGDVAAIEGRVVESCRRCHEGATPQFASAWLRHYTPTWKSAPLVWAIQWTYRLMIPFIVLGLVLHILLHLWRVRAHTRGAASA